MTTIENIVNFVTNWQGEYDENGVLKPNETKRLVSELQVKIGEMSFDAGESKIIPYNGYIGDTPAWKIAEGASNSNGGKLFYISDLEPGKLLNTI